jgi:Fe2+ transport system protein FeoA
MAAALATHPSLLGGRSSLVVWGALPPDASGPEVLTKHGGTRDGIQLHRATSLGRPDLCALKNLPLTAPARSLLGFAPRADAYDLETALNELRAAKLLRLADLDELRSRTHGHRGWGPLGRLLAAEAEPGFSRKEAELRILRLIRAASLPSPRRNVRVGRWEVDLLWPEAKLAVEVDSYAFHSSRRAFERDRRKQAELHLTRLGASRPRTHKAPLGQRDQLLDLGLDGLGLCLRRADPLVLDELLAEVAEQRLTMRRVAAQLVPVATVAHRIVTPRAATGRAGLAPRRLPRSTAHRNSGWRSAPRRTSPSGRRSSARPPA